VAETITEEFVAAPGAETEYRVIRDEILERIRQRQQLIAGTLTLGGVFLAAGITRPHIALVYPLLAAFLALAWAQNDFRVRELARYIRTHISPILTAARWESFLLENRGTTRLSGWRMVVLSHGGVFLFTQLTALFVGTVGSFGALRPSLEPAFVVPATLAGIDVIAVLLVAWVLLNARRVDEDSKPADEPPAGSSAPGKLLLPDLTMKTDIPGPPAADPPAPPTAAIPVPVIAVRDEPPSEESVRAAMDWAWRDHHHARDQTWKALQMEAVLGAGLVTVDARYASLWPTLGTALLVILTAAFGLMISWHHRKLERRKILHVYRCEEWLGLHREELIPKVEKLGATATRDVRDAAVEPPKPFTFWQVFDPRKTNTALFIMRMHIAIMIFAIIVTSARYASVENDSPPGSRPEAAQAADAAGDE
jgi:hypothetical protein